MRKIYLLTIFVVVLLLSIGCGSVDSKYAGTYYNITDNSSYIEVYEDNTANLTNVYINGKKYTVTNCQLTILDGGKRIRVTHQTERIDITVAFDGTTIKYGDYSFKKK